MVLFVTSSPYVNDADRAILSNDNDFIDRIRGVLPPCPRAQKTARPAAFAGQNGRADHLKTKG